MNKNILKIICPYCGNIQSVKQNPWTVEAKCQNKKCNKWFDVKANTMK